MSKIQSLEELSFNSIICNFYRFTEAYNTKNKMYEKNLEFLQRKYSAEMLKKLGDKKAIKDEYLDLILNKYVRELNTDVFDFCSWERVEKKLIEIGDVILILTFSKKITYEQRINIIRSLKNVEILNFERKCNDDVMKVVGEHCPKLIKLDIYGTAVTNQGLKFLYLSNNNEIKNNIPLKHIILNETKVDMEGIFLLLNNVPSLEIIDHPYIVDVLHSIYNDSIMRKEKVKKYNLTSLFVNCLKFNIESDVILSIYLEMCPNIKCLNIPSLKSMNELILCQKFTNLQDVTLIRNNNGPFDINEFIKLKGNTIRRLKLQNFKLSVKILVESCPKLEYLFLSSIHNDEVSDANLASLKCLTRLIIENHLFDKSDALLLSSCPNLEVLRIITCGAFCDEINNAILKSSTLKEIEFIITSFEIKYLEAIILSLTSLQIFNLTQISNVSKSEYLTLLGLSDLSSTTSIFPLPTNGMNVKICWELNEYALVEAYSNAFDMYHYEDSEDEFDDEQYSSSSDSIGFDEDNYYILKHGR